MFETVLLLAPVALTSAGAYVLGRRRALARPGLRAALARTLECLGLAVAFLLLNMAAGAAAILALRAAGAFVSLYLIADSTLILLSALQAVAFRWWWGNGEGQRADV